MKIEKDNFNSNHFGIEMGNVVIGNEVFDDETFRTTLLKDDDFKNYKHLTLRIPTRDKITTNAAIKTGFSICDTLVEWIFNYSKSELPVICPKVILRECDKDDLEELKIISRNSFKIDRFHSDPSLDNNLCDSYYEKWIENSYYGYAEAIIVAEYSGNVVGYTTIKTYSDDDVGHLVLSAVSEKYRGLGIYTSLIHKCVEWVHIKHPDLKGIIVGTQIDNIAVQKAWNKLGFSPFDSKYVLQMSM